MNAKILDAFRKNKTRSEFGCRDLEFNKIAEFNNNYFISFGCIHILYDSGYYFKRYGNYLIAFERVSMSRAVYCPESDTALSVDEAFENGILTEADIAKFVEYYHNWSIGCRIGDSNADNCIDIIDLARLRLYIVRDYDPETIRFDSEAIFYDMDKNDNVDISDVVIMRNIIVNGEGISDNQKNSSKEIESDTQNSFSSV